MRNPGSFRDPSAYVFSAGARIFRAVNDEAWRNFQRFKSSGAYDDLHARRWIIATDDDATPDDAHGGRRLFEHPRLPFVSYPYEWPFALLKRAALLHLDIHLRALDFGFTLSDASAYNVQFVGIQPIFIDTASFVPYREGDYWAGHRQFVEQFVNPLLLRALFGISANAWYRGMLEGLPTGDVAQLIGPVRRWLAPNVLINITLPDLLQRRARRRGDLETAPSRPLPKTALRLMLQRLRDWISGLVPKDAEPSAWQGYEADNSYPPGDEERKRAFVAQFSLATRPSRTCDVGCNSGYYSEVLLQSGARSVIGFDSDIQCTGTSRVPCDDGAAQLPSTVLRRRESEPCTRLGGARAPRIARARQCRRHAGAGHRSSSGHRQKRPAGLGSRMADEHRAARRHRIRSEVGPDDPAHVAAESRYLRRLRQGAVRGRALPATGGSHACSNCRRAVERFTNTNGR